jgi:ribosome-associated toxin RatA of RatAB toxin-antitoxin module
VNMHPCWLALAIFIAGDLGMQVCQAGGATTRSYGVAHAQQLVSTEPEPPIQVIMVPVPGSSVQSGRAIGVVRAPIAKVRNVVTDYASYSRFVPYIDVSKVLAKRGANAYLYVQTPVLKGMTTFWVQLKAYGLKPLQNTEVFEAKKLQGNVGKAFARWELTPVSATQTRVAFQILVEPEFPLPASFLSDQNAKTAKRVIQALRKEVSARQMASTSSPASAPASARGTPPDAPRTSPSSRPEAGAKRP